MNGIKMSQCKFYVDEAARTVVCVIPATTDLVQDFVEEHFDFTDLNINFGLTYDWLARNLFMPRSFMGKAVCAADDEWDEKTGKLIAYSRAKDKCYKSFFKRANRLVQLIDRRLNDMITMFNDFGLKLENNREMLQAKIDHQLDKEKKGGT